MDVVFRIVFFPPAWEVYVFFTLIFCAILFI